MSKRGEAGSLAAFVAVAGLLLTGCATTIDSTSAASIEQVVGEIAPDPDCGTFGIIESVPGGGASTRQGALEAMVRGHQAIIGTPQAVRLRSTPEDVLLTLQAALRALPDVERQAAPEASVTVPAVAEDGTELGEFLIIPNGDNYVISTYSVTHVSGVPCLPPTG